MRSGVGKRGDHQAWVATVQRPEASVDMLQDDGRIPCGHCHSEKRCGRWNLTDEGGGWVGILEDFMFVMWNLRGG